jgi:transposase
LPKASAPVTVATRTEAAKIGGVGLQVVRDWVMKFNADGPEGLIDRKAPGQPPQLNDGIVRRWPQSSRAGRFRRSMGWCASGLLGRELAETIKRKASLDWTQRDSVRADIRRTVRRLLAKYGYPPDAQETATQLVIRQAELMAKYQV